MTTRTARRTVRAVIADAVSTSRPGQLRPPAQSLTGLMIAGDAIEQGALGGAGTLIGLYRDVRPQTAGRLRSEDRGDPPPQSEVHR